MAIESGETVDMLMCYDLVSVSSTSEIPLIAVALSDASISRVPSGIDGTLCHRHFQLKAFSHSPAVKGGSVTSSGAVDQCC